MAAIACLLSPFQVRSGRNQPSNKQVRVRAGDVDSEPHRAPRWAGTGLCRLLGAGDRGRRGAVG